MRNPETQGPGSQHGLPMDSAVEDSVFDKPGLWLGSGINR
jgi:hypothetical protein